MTPLPPEVAARLTKICGLLGSDHDGERSAAALQATRLLRAHGLGWADIVRPALPAPEPSLAPRQHVHTHDAVRFALRHMDALTAWEIGFLRGIVHRPRLSPRQQETLAGIVAGLRRGGAV